MEIIVMFNGEILPKDGIKLNELFCSAFNISSKLNQLNTPGL